MSFLFFVLWAVLGILAALWLARRINHQQLPQRALRKRLRYLQPYKPAAQSLQEGATCD